MVSTQARIGKDVFVISASVSRVCALTTCRLVDRPAPRIMVPGGLAWRWQICAEVNQATERARVHHSKSPPDHVRRTDLACPLRDLSVRRSPSWGRIHPIWQSLAKPQRSARRWRRFCGTDAWGV